MWLLLQIQLPFLEEQTPLREGWASRWAFPGVAGPGPCGARPQGVQDPDGDGAPAARLRRQTRGQASLRPHPDLLATWADASVAVGGAWGLRASVPRPEGWGQNLASSTYGRLDFGQLNSGASVSSSVKRDNRVHISQGGCKG